MSVDSDKRFYSHVHLVTEDEMDINGHVNNLSYLRWMQDIAIHHAQSVGSTRVNEREGTTWFVRSHHVDYKQPAYAGEEVRIITWVHDYRRSASHRRYSVRRASDNAELARGETLWVYVDRESGRPLPIPDEIKSLFTLVPEGDEP
jgi:acyl-CoA thioester hydrolase